MKLTNYKIDKKAKVWHHFDAKDQILGRLATKIARILMGKHKPNYTPLFDSGDYVVVTNAKHIRLSGVKEVQKKYHRHSGYLGSIKTTTFEEMRTKKPEFIIQNAVRLMLPKTIQARVMIKKLRVYPEAEHPHQGQTFVEKDLK